MPIFYDVVDKVCAQIWGLVTWWYRTLASRHNYKEGQRRATRSEWLVSVSCPAQNVRSNFWIGCRGRLWSWSAKVASAIRSMVSRKTPFPILSQPLSDILSKSIVLVCKLCVFWCQPKYGDQTIIFCPTLSAPDFFQDWYTQVTRFSGEASAIEIHTRNRGISGCHVQHVGRYH